LPADIVKDLESAPEQFRLIAEDLSRTTSDGGNPR